MQGLNSRGMTNIPSMTHVSAIVDGGATNIPIDVPPTIDWHKQILLSC